MKILVACEYSGIVREAFRSRGHDAISCDILPTEIPGPHWQGDVTELLDRNWDMILAFPPCTKLSKVGAAYWPRWQADGSQQEAIDFFNLFVVTANAEKIVIENPAGIMSRLYRKPDQYIQPWMFGHPWKKATGLWLKGVSKLKPENVVEPVGHWVDGGTFKRHGSGALEGAYGGAEKKNNAERAKERSRTFQGIANAMANQWG